MAAAAVAVAAAADAAAAAATAACPAEHIDMQFMVNFEGYDADIRSKMHAPTPMYEDVRFDSNLGGDCPLPNPTQPNPFYTRACSSTTGHPLLRNLMI